MKALDRNTGTFKEVYVKALDSMPVGTVVEYAGQASDIPVGWEQVSGENKIEKVGNTRPLTGSVVNEYNTSDKNAYSCEYINEINTYSENETFTGKYHTDGKKIYRKVVKVTGTLNPGTENRVGSIDNLDTLISLTGTGVLQSQYYVPLPYISNTDNVALYIRNVTNTYRPTIVPQSTNITNMVIIVEYTKTTDTAQANVLSSPTNVEPTEESI